MPTEQPDQSPHKPPGRMRLLWQALGRNRAGRLLRLAIIAITGWAAVEMVTGISREIYRANTASDPGFAVSYAIDYAMGLRVQTDRDVAALPKEPAYPLPPTCLEGPLYEADKKIPFYDRLAACVGNIGSHDPIFGGLCRLEVDWKTYCRSQVYRMDVLEHPESFARLISAIKNPCSYLPSPEKIATASETHESWVRKLNEAWIDGGCDGSHELPLFWYQLDFIRPSKLAPEKMGRLSVMVSTRD